MCSKTTCFMVAALLLLQACTSPSKISSFDESLQADYIPSKESQWAYEQGEKLHSEIKSKGLIYRDREVQQYISGLENRLLAQRPDYDAVIQVFVIRSPDASAMALPNGVIYLNSGLFTVLDNEDQLASILAHKITHITQRHSVKSVIHNKNTLATAHVADLFTGGLGLTYLPALASIMSFSREHEEEADQIGLNMLAQAQYDPMAMAETFQRLKQAPELKHVKNSMFSSHPSQDARITYLEAQAKLITQDENIASSTAQDRFLSVKAKLMTTNVKMRIKARQFQLALNILEQAENYYPNNVMLAYYRAESYRGMAKYPADAGREKYWLETGKDSAKKAYTENFESEKINYLKTSERLYNSALTAQGPYPPAYKGLAEVKQFQGDILSAIEAYKRFLITDPKTDYRRYIERKIEQLSIAAEKESTP